MKLFLVILFVIVAVVVAKKDDDDDEDLWKSYKSTFGKKHPPENEIIRKKTFINRRKDIEKHNRENKEWKKGLNKFTDMSDEKKKAFRGAKMLKMRERTNGTADDLPGLDRALPSLIDYRRHRCLRPIKIDQGECGSCWSYAAITALEFNTCRKSGAQISMSEQMLVDCDPNNNGCRGGDYTGAWQYIQEVGGAMKSVDYPYISRTTLSNGTCRFNNSLKVAIKVSSYGWVMPYPNENVIRARLQSDGPLPSSMKVIDSFFDYASGVYSDPACIVTDENSVDHAIVIVGYGTTNATSTTPATPYWIVRNSWGIDWGIKGYFLIKRGVNMCNIESWAAYVKIG
uniref:Peptidase C1A papain C-terminal domain-containing protein n=1 Tax=Daphnia galeata TaxID=27404 RepID=A0A8J2RPV3_9CRUS|nr:unnamed protein product [Daphnia galeata]